MISAPANFVQANAELVKQPLIRIEIDGYSRVFTNYATVTAGEFPWIKSIQDHAITVNDLDGGADLAQLIFNVQDRDSQITADFPGFVFEGKKLTLKTALRTATLESDFATLFTGKISSVASDNANTEYCFTTDDPRQELAKVIFTLGDDGSPTDSKHPHTLNAHPIDIFINILEVELGILPGDIDLAKLTQYRDTIYSGVNFQFKLTSPPAAKDFIENELMKPLGAYLRVNNLGQITADFFYPLELTPVFTLDPSNLTDMPIAGQADLINQVSLRFDYDDQDKPLSESINEDGDSIAKYGMFGEHVIEAKGLRSGFNGFFLSALVSGLIFLRYGDKQLAFADNTGGGSSGGMVEAIWSACLIEPGDFVLVTHPQVPDRARGVLGITDKAFVVLDRNWNFTDCKVQLKLLSVDLSLFRQFLITPDSEPHYVPAGAADDAKYMFMCGDNDQYSNGAPGNTLG